jgi:hypothetical protein
MNRTASTMITMTTIAVTLINMECSCVEGVKRGA